MKLKLYIFLFFVICTYWSCSNKPKTLFRQISAAHSGITFENTIYESDSFNILTTEYIYNGGGVGIADFNQDGLVDLFFCGNMNSNKLYLNKGNLKFEDVSEAAKISGKDKWNSGVSIVDINNDGKADIYVSATMKKDSASRKNLLLINTGNDAHGVPIFKDEAAKYGIDYGGYSVMSSFFDYDNDGDLDLFILTNVKINNQPTTYRNKINDGSSPNNDKLFRNNGNGTFSDVTLVAGIKEEGFGLGLSIADLNSDGWPDIYVSNDYLSNDVLYLNRKDGTFENATPEHITHQSQFSMGNDVADFNNDALPDIITLDMLPENNDRIKTTISSKNYQNYINNERFGYQNQYVRNMLHLNNGMSKGIKFSEIGELSDIFRTEWSWSPLFFDVDNDGWKDLLITNGFPRDITDKDFANYRADVGNIASTKSLLDSIPIIKIPNYAFKNNTDLTFSNVSEIWGLNIPSFSNGAAFGDLDNDGDLDYVVNNINEPAFVYENTINENATKPNYITIRLIGKNDNINAIGAKVYVYYDHEKIQFSELFPHRGFLSSVLTDLHFGLGNSTRIDSIQIHWPDGETSLLTEVKVNQKIEADYAKITKKNPPNTASAPMLFSSANQLLNLHFKHVEKDQNDFTTQRTLPHKFSQYGPGIAVADINGDDVEDLIVGGSFDHATTVFLRNKDGKFKSEAKLQKTGKLYEDQGLLLFDVDSDGDRDLYIVGGGLELNYSKAVYQSHLFLNDGKGNFKESETNQPNSSGSCARAADFDGDGDLDLFLGGRVIPGEYPSSPESFLLQNNNGKLSDVTKSLAPGLQHAGMISDALWTDFDADGAVDLMLVGEFMPITFYKNSGGKFELWSTSNIESVNGWWNSICPGDFDQDGDTDYVVGNLGRNNIYQVSAETPLKLIAKDFDNNGSIDPILACYMKGSMSDQTKKLYPVHFWDELNSQSPLFRRKFQRYRQYAKIDLDHLFSENERKDAVIFTANEMNTSYVENLGNGKFAVRSMDMRTQFAPVFGMLSGFFDDDSFLDVLMVGNDFGNEVFAGRYDAFTGLFMRGDGKANFLPLTSAQTGFYVPGNAKGLALMNYDSEPIFLATQNQDSLKVFKATKKLKPKIFKPEPMDAYSIITFTNGKKQKIEFYYGCGFLSQSSRTIFLPTDADSITVTDFRGAKRTIRL